MQARPKWEECHLHEHNSGMQSPSLCPPSMTAARCWRPIEPMSPRLTDSSLSTCFRGRALNRGGALSRLATYTLNLIPESRMRFACPAIYTRGP